MMKKRLDKPNPIRAGGSPQDFRSLGVVERNAENICRQLVATAKEQNLWASERFADQRVEK
jgi:hypothetical protein